MTYLEDPHSPSRAETDAGSQGIARFATAVPGYVPATAPDPPTVPEPRGRQLARGEPRARRLRPRAGPWPDIETGDAPSKSGGVLRSWRNANELLGGDPHVRQRTFQALHLLRAE